MVTEAAESYTGLHVVMLRTVLDYRTAGDARRDAVTIPGAYDKPGHDSRHGVLGGWNLV
jgi:hypothetical protein